MITITSLFAACFVVGKAEGSGAFLAGTVVHDGIAINNDAQFAAKAEAEGWPGSGTSGSPYIIDGLYINALRSGNCIYIGNTTVHFIIQNCELRSASVQGPSVYSIGAGVELYYAHNGTIRDNLIWGNYWGIFLRSSSDCLVQNSSVSQNTYGLRLWYSQHITVENSNFSHCENGGIYIDYSDDNTISGCDVSFSYTGVYLAWSARNTVSELRDVRCYVPFNVNGGSNHVIKDCGIQDGYYQGIMLQNTEGVKLYSNHLLKCSVYLTGGINTFITQTIPNNNTVNGRPVHYLKNASMGGLAAPSGVGEVILGNVTDFQILDQDLSNQTHGVVIGFSDHINVERCKFSDDYYGMWGTFVADSSFSHNNIKNALGYGAYFTDSDRNTFSKSIFNGSYYGICLISSDLCTIEKSTFSGGYYGIYLSYSNYATVSQNTLSGTTIYLDGDLDAYTTHFISADNLVDGDPVYYYSGVDMGGAIAPTDGGQYILGQVSDFIIESLNYTGGNNRIILGFSDNITIRSCSFTDSQNGIAVYWSNTNLFQDLEMDHVSSQGIYLYESDHNSVWGGHYLYSYYAIYMNGCFNSFLTNVNISYSSYGYGLYLDSCEYVNVKTCELNDHNYGIYAEYTDYLTVLGTTIRNCMNGGGIYLYTSHLAELYDNNLYRCGVRLYGDIETWITQAMDTSNTVNDNPLYYYADFDMANGSVPVDAGQVILGGMGQVTVTGLHISNVTEAIAIGFSSNIYVHDNVITYNNKAVWSYCSSNVHIYSNQGRYNGYSVYLEASSVGMRVRDNDLRWDNSIAIYIQTSSTTQVRNNLINTTAYGIGIYYSSNCVFTGNTLQRCSFVFSGGSKDTYTSQSIESTNTVNGKPVYYAANVNMNNASVPVNQGQVILAGVKYAKVQDQQFSNQTHGVILAYCYGIEVYDCKFYFVSYGVTLYCTDYSTVRNGTVHGGGNSGVYGNYAFDLTVKDMVFESGSYSIWLSYCHNSLVKNNNFTSGFIGVYSSYSLRVTVMDNQIKGPTYGVYLYGTRLGLLSDNKIENAYIGIYLSYRCDSIDVRDNLVANCSSYGIYVYQGISNIFADNALMKNRGSTNVYDPAKVQAYDNWPYDRWDGLMMDGNLWLDWTYPDSDHNGVVDYPYLLDGGAEAKDLLPKSDVAGPQLAILTPTHGQTMANMTVNVTWEGSSELSGLDHYEVKVDSGSWANVSMNTSKLVTFSAFGAHQVFVRAYDRAANHLERNVTFIVAAIPEAITTLSAVPGSSQIVLSWEAPFDSGSPITNYIVYRSTTSGVYGAPLATLTSPTVLTYTDASAVVGATYYYVVKSANTVGNSSASNEVNASIVVGPPDAPTGLVADPGVGYVSLNWNAPSNTGSGPITVYKVYRTTIQGVYSPTPVATVVGATTTYYMDRDLAAGTYYYRVTAVNTVEGPKSNEAIAVEQGVHTGTPGVITQMSLNSHKDRVDLSWTAPSDGGSAITQYHIFRSGVDSGPVQIGTSTTTSYTDSTVTEGHVYYYWIAAANTNGQGPISASMHTKAQEPAGTMDLSILIVVIVIVLALVAVAFYFLKMRKK